MGEPEIPTYRKFLLPVLQVLENEHGSLSKAEIDEAVIDLLNLTDEQVAVTYPPGSKAKGSKILHRIAFARSSLKLSGAIDNETRGIWTLDQYGRELLAAGEQAAIGADATMRRELAEKRRAREVASGSLEPVAEDEDETVAEEATELIEDAWQAELLEQVQALSPSGFERLCARLLRRSGCRDVEVTQSSNDQGLDGVGVLEVSLLSFPVFFQAKKYAGTVGPNVVRELRGAMVGRGDKGILITTGRFTSAAKDEARRPGAPPVDLIDGPRLCDLMLELGIGVRQLPVVDRSFFETI